MRRIDTDDDVINHVHTYLLWFFLGRTFSFWLTMLDRGVAGHLSMDSVIGREGDKGGFRGAGVAPQGSKG